MCSHRQRTFWFSRPPKPSVTRSTPTMGDTVPSRSMPIVFGTTGFSLHFADDADPKCDTCPRDCWGQWAQCASKQEIPCLEEEKPEQSLILQGIQLSMFKWVLCEINTELELTAVVRSETGSEEGKRGRSVTHAGSKGQSDCIMSHTLGARGRPQMGQC